MVRGMEMHGSRKFLVVASVFGFTGVALGAFAAHTLKSTISSDMLSVFDTGVRYQMYHTFALFVVSWFLHVQENRKLTMAAWLFVAGVILFSGSLYVLAMTSIESFGFVTPVGGLCFLGGWCLAVLGFLQENPE